MQHFIKYSPGKVMSTWRKLEIISIDSDAIDILYLSDTAEKVGMQCDSNHVCINFGEVLYNSISEYGASTKLSI
jgi:hypothetical protein